MTTNRDRIAAALPSYEIQAEIGRGAWGVVLAAEHRQLGRGVAVKQLPEAFAADPLVQRRFTSEARLLASLDHPHIVPIFDYVQDNGLWLLVMELLPGGTVRDRFTTMGIGAKDACSIVLATCAALHYAHLKGILHRDIKPENLLFNASGTLKVTDFGIAKVLGGAETLVTRTGDVLGTPAYMAPEQVTGRTLSPATDVYAVATMLYELLSGQLPFSDEGGVIAALYRHVYEQPTPLLDVGPDVPDAIAQVVMQALATDPGQRQPTAEDFGVAVADAANESWGPGWLNDTDLDVMTSRRVAQRISNPTNQTTREATPEAVIGLAELLGKGEPLPLERPSPGTPFPLTPPAPLAPAREMPQASPAVTTPADAVVAPPTTPAAANPSESATSAIASTIAIPAGATPTVAIPGSAASGVSLPPAAPPAGAIGIPIAGATPTVAIPAGTTPARAPTTPDTANPAGATPARAPTTPDTANPASATPARAPTTPDTAIPASATPSSGGPSGAAPGAGAPGSTSGDAAPFGGTLPFEKSAGDSGGKRRPIVILGILAAAIVVVAVVAFVVTRSTSGRSAGVSATSTTSGPGTSTRVVFTDNFTDSASGWVPDAGQDGTGSAGYQSDGFLVSVLKPLPPLNTFSLTSPYTPKLTSMLVTGHATFVTAAAADGAGVRCDQGSRTGLRYTFEVFNNGTWVIFKIDTSGNTALMTGSSPVTATAAGYTVTGQCSEVGNGATKLSMTVNAVAVGSVTDSHGGGPIGWNAALVVYRSMSSPATTVRFNSFRILAVSTS